MEHKHLSKSESELVEHQILEAQKLFRAKKKTNKRSNTIPDEDGRLIEIAYHSGNSRLKELAIILAEEELMGLAEAWIKKTGANEYDTEDCKSAAKIVILEHLGGFDSDKGKLPYYFQARFQHAFLEVLNPDKSKYYVIEGITINKVIQNFRARGIEPTLSQIADETGLSEGAIQSCLDTHKDVCSIDNIPEQKSEFANPEYQMMKKEETENFYKAIQKMTPLLGKIMAIKVAMDNDEVTGQTELLRRCRDLIDPALSSDKVKKLEQKAIMQFKKNLKATRHEPERLQLNYFEPVLDFEQETEDILSAIEQDPEYIFEVLV